jgi:hypothetical protein
MIAASGYEPTPPIGKQHYYICARRFGAFLRWAEMNDMTSKSVRMGAHKQVPQMQ